MSALLWVKAGSSMLTLMMPGRCSSSLSVSVLDLDLAANTETALVERLRLALEDDTVAWVAGRSCKRAAIVVKVLYLQLDHFWTCSMTNGVVLWRQCSSACIGTVDARLKTVLRL